MKENEIVNITPTIDASKSLQKKDEQKFFSFPNSPASNSMINIVSHADNLEAFAERMEENSHSTQIDFFTPPDGSSKEVSQRVKYSTDNTETTVHLDNIDLFSKAKKPLKKILTYTLVKLSRENVNTLTGEQDIAIRFPLEDFVDLGCYKTITTARQAFNQAKNPLTSIKIEGVVRDKRDMKQITDSGIEVLFTGAHIKKGIVEIYLNKRINWKVFALQYFSILPKSYFSLSDNAADTLLNISMLARKRISEIKKKGYFNLSFKTLQQILDLPDENKTKNPGRDIKEPILHAISEINDSDNGDIHIEACYDSNGNINQFLTNGYAQIKVFNDYAEFFNGLAENKENRIEEAIKKHKAKSLVQKN